MAIPHTPSYTLQRFHYARLLITPLPSPSSAEEPTVDRLTTLQLVDKILSEWYGTMGGPGGVGEVDVVSVAKEAPKGGKGAEREVIIRFPSATTHSLLTALPLSTPTLSGQAYRLAVISDSADLQRLAGVGPAARGKQGYREWVKELKAEKGKEGMVVG